MSVFNLRLESVQRKTGGRIHLTPRVPRTGPVTTLCGQTLAAGSFVAVERDPDCTNCLRRSRDPSRISGAFFEQEEGSQLLQLSLEQARARRPAGKGPAAPGKPIVRVLPTPPSIPDRAGELMTAGFKAAGEGLWRSPGADAQAGPRLALRRACLRGLCRRDAAGWRGQASRRGCGGAPNG